MNRSITLLSLATFLTACQTPAPTVDRPAKGLSSVNIPVVTRADYAFTVAAPYGSVPASESARLTSWFDAMDLRYGDKIHVESTSGNEVRSEIARIAGQYGLSVSPGFPILQDPSKQDEVRIIVARNTAAVPACPNWSKASTPTFDDASMSNFGCGVNSNLAAMIADPQDLVSGKEGVLTADPEVSAKAIAAYRKAAPTGQSGLKDISTKGQ